VQEVSCALALSKRIGSKGPRADDISATLIAVGAPYGPSSFTRLHAAERSGAGHFICGGSAHPKGGAVYLYAILSLIVGGLGLAWLAKRRRKADGKAA
jgi:hypothetical protein